MKRSTFTPKPTWKPLKAKKPMARGTSRMPAKKKAADKPKRHAREQQDKHLADMCRGQPCYVLAPGVACQSRETVVPCHSNQQRHGKGKSIKAYHRYTAPGCAACHYELDFGTRMTKEEKFALWDDAYARWAPVRDKLLSAQAQGVDESHKETSHEF